MIILKALECYSRQFLSPDTRTKRINTICEKKSPKNLFLLKRVVSTVYLLSI